MAQIDSLDNLISEFEKVAPTIEQLLKMAAEAAELKKKLVVAHTEATTKLAEIAGEQQRLNQSLTDIGPLKQSLESRIDATKTLETNVSKALIGLKNDLTGKVDSAISKLDAALMSFSAASAKLLTDKAIFADQAPLATPNCSTYGRSNCSRQDGWIMPALGWRRYARRPL